MKKGLVLIALLLLSAICTDAQTLADVKKSESLTWYGIDFSEARFLNFGAYVSDKSVKKSLPQWSYHPFGADDIEKWKKKYKKDKLVVDIKQSGKRNDSTDFDKHMSTEPFSMNIEDIKKIVAEYDIKGDGYGLLYIVESFQNSGKTSNIWSVFINQSDKTVIDAQRFTNETYGLWTEAIDHTIKQSAKQLSSAK